MAFKGIDVRETSDRLLFRNFIQDEDGNIVVSGTTLLRLYELQSDGTLKSYDFNDNTFKTGALTTETLAMTHRAGNNGATNTGLWTATLTTLSGFAKGNLYVAHVTNAAGSPPVQAREFQFGSAQGDLSVDASNNLNANTNAMSANVLTASALATDAVNEIVASIVAGTFTIEDIDELLSTQHGDGLWTTGGAPTIEVIEVQDQVEV